MLQNKRTSIHKQMQFLPKHMNTSINWLIYGMNVQRISANGLKMTIIKLGKKKHYRFYYIVEDQLLYLQYISKKKNLNRTRIDLSKIDYIKETPDSKYIQENYDEGLMLSVSCEGQINIFFFDSLEQKLIWWQGLKHFMELANKQQSRQFDQTNQNLKQFFSADQDGSKQLSQDEVFKYLKKINVNISKEYLQLIMNRYDDNKDGYIDQQEFKKLIQKVTQKKEILPLFKRYCKLAQLNDQEIVDSDPLMTIVELKCFLNVEQNQYQIDEKFKEAIALELINSEQIKKKWNNEISDNNKNQGIIKNNELSTSTGKPEIIASLQNENEVAQRFNQPPVEYILKNYEGPVITFVLFSSIIFNSNNSLFDSQLGVIKDMDYPLSNYYINSSHNTYLMSNQLSGESSCDAYIYALQRGCRCVELDVWDGPNGQPIITHGHTMTSKILFEDVIKAIDEFSFQTNPYPVILSLELHCQFVQQEIMANILVKVLGAKLFLLPENWDKYLQYLSPNNLRERFIVKGSGDMHDAAQFLYLVQDKLQKEIQEPNTSKVPIKHNLHIQKNMKLKSLMGLMHLKKQDIPPEPQGRTIKVEEKLLVLKVEEKLIVLKVEEKQISLKEPKLEEKIIHNHPKLVSCVTLFNLYGIYYNLQGNVCSINEDKVQKLVEESLNDFCDFNRINFTRVFPGATRIGSSNYDPCPSFLAGAQIVALNFQTKDIHMLINEARFLSHGGQACGFSLKPSYLRMDNGLKIYPGDMLKPKQQIMITIISGSQLSNTEDTQEQKQAVDPYIEVQIHGNPIDQRNNKPFKTNVVLQNSNSPQFNEAFTFVVRDPEQAILVFKAWDSNMLKDCLLGWYAVPFTCLRSGYRVVHLKNKELEFIDYSFILVKVKIDDL